MQIAIKRFYFLVILFLTFTFQGYGQIKYSLLVKLNDSLVDKELTKQVQRKKEYSSVQEMDGAIKDLFFEFYERGYLTASADSFNSDSLHTLIYITAGNPYKWASLTSGNVEEEIINAIGFRERFYDQHTFSPRETARLLERIITYGENNGYPFATVKLDSIFISGENISAALNLQKNQLCLIDSFLVKGNAKISNYYVQRLLGIRKGDKYNESRVTQISKRIREVPFLSEGKSSEIYFADKYTKLILTLNQKKANRFDGVLGFMPNPTTGKLLVTGQLTLKLVNSFNKGEVLDVDWQKLQVKTQNLKARLQVPFLFHSPFGADILFKLYKRDTLFTDVNENIGLNYLIGTNKYFKVFFSNRTIALISTRGLENLTALPAYVDMNSKSYGIGFRTENLDNKLNPRKGYTLDINASAGTKKIKKNLKIKPEVYDGTRLKTDIYVIDFSGELFVPIKKRSTLVFGNKSAWIESANLFVNELYRIGGLNSLRGFDEESINASFYTITKLEYRLIVDQNSYLFLFGNHAYYQNKTALDNNSLRYTLEDNPFGFGAGITFETKPGIFSLSYALGKQFNNPISLRSAKVHFGIVSTF